jgi:hypothetical protein
LFIGGTSTLTAQFSDPVRLPGMARWLGAGNVL